MKPAASSSRSQRAMSPATTLTRLTCLALSVGVLWRPLVSVAVVTQLVTHPPRGAAVVATGQYHPPRTGMAMPDVVQRLVGPTPARPQLLPVLGVPGALDRGRRRCQNRRVLSLSWLHLPRTRGKPETTPWHRPSRPARRSRTRRRRADLSGVRADVRTGERHRVPHRYRCIRRARRARQQHPGPRRLRRRRQDRRAATAAR